MNRGGQVAGGMGAWIQDFLKGKAYGNAWPQGHGKG